MRGTAEPFLATSRRLAAAAFAASLFAFAAPASAQSMSKDFTNIMQWLSHEMAQGIAFNAGSTFDPPREVKSRRLQPDVSIGVGSMPFDKSKFPELEVAALREMNAKDVFPERSLFPNLTMHLRAGLPGRNDFGLRFANMTTPPGHKISANAPASGQSNSIGFSVRRHYFGGPHPLLTLGAHFNHVYGRFLFNTKFGIDNVQGFSADTDVNGSIVWNVSSYGLNAVMSHNFGMWTPFLGLGYNYVTGSVATRLEAVSGTPLIAPIIGQSSDHPEQNQGRVIFGAQLNRSWVNFFANGEVKALGIGAGKAWIVHAGISLPFTIGAKGGLIAKAEKAPRRAARPVIVSSVVRPRDDEEMRDAVKDEPPPKPRARRLPPPRREIFGGEPAVPASESSAGSGLIFIQ